MDNSKNESNNLLEKKINIGYEYLSRGYFDEALNFFSEVLNEENNNNKAYVGKVLCEKKCKGISELGDLIYKKEEAESIYSKLTEEEQEVLLNAFAQKAISDKGSIYGITLAFFNYEIANKSIFLDAMFEYTWNNADERMFDYLIKYVDEITKRMRYLQFIEILKNKAAASIFKYVGEYLDFSEEPDFVFVADIVSNIFKKNDSHNLCQKKCEGFDLLMTKYNGYFEIENIALDLADDLVKLGMFDLANKYYLSLKEKNQGNIKCLKGLLLCKAQVKKIAELEKYQVPLKEVEEFKALLLASDKKLEKQLLDVIDKQKEYLLRQEEIQKDALRLQEMVAMQERIRKEQEEENIRLRKKESRKRLISNLIFILVPLLLGFFEVICVINAHASNLYKYVAIIMLVFSIIGLNRSRRNRDDKPASSEWLAIFYCLISAFCVYLCLGVNRDIFYAVEDSFLWIAELEYLLEMDIIVAVLSNLWVLIFVDIILLMILIIYRMTYSVGKTILIFFFLGGVILEIAFGVLMIIPSLLELDFRLLIYSILAALSFYLFYTYRKVLDN